MGQLARYATSDLLRDQGRGAGGICWVDLFGDQNPTRRFSDGPKIARKRRLFLWGSIYMVISITTDTISRISLFV